MMQVAKPLGQSWSPSTSPGPTQCHSAPHLDAIKQQCAESWPGPPTDMSPLDDEDIEAATSEGCSVPRVTC